MGIRKEGTGKGMAVSKARRWLITIFIRRFGASCVSDLAVKRTRVLNAGS